MLTNRLTRVVIALAVVSAAARAQVAPPAGPVQKKPVIATPSTATGKDVPPQAARGAATGKIVPPQTTAGMATGKRVESAQSQWTQPFELGPGERAGFGFVVGGPGPIVVVAQWTGVPLTISLMKPGGASIDQQGAGSVTLNYSATAEDVKNGTLWAVNIRPSVQAPKPANASGIAGGDRPIRIDMTSVAKGTLNARHPAGDVNLAQSQLSAKSKQAFAAQPASPPAATVLTGILAQRQSAAQAQQNALLGTALQKVQSRIPVQTFQQMSTKIAVREKVRLTGAAVATPANPSGFSATISGGDVVLRWNPVANAIYYNLQGAGVKEVSGMPPNVNGTTYTVSGLPVGTHSWVLFAVYSGSSGPYFGDESNPARVTATMRAGGPVRPASPPVPPVIASLSASTGTPGTPVLIEGSGLSRASGGEVHLAFGQLDFIMSANLPDGSTGWISDSKILVTVPDVLRVFNLTFIGDAAKVYVRLGSGAESNRMSFTFVPSTQYAVYPLKEANVRLQKGDGGDDNWTSSLDQNQQMVHHSSSLMFGHKGDDYYLQNVQLKNGWVLDEVVLWNDYGQNWYLLNRGSQFYPLAGASIAEAGYGTNLMTTKIHWWNIGYCSGFYSIGFIIRGPWGVPYQ